MVRLGIAEKISKMFWNIGLYNWWLAQIYNNTTRTLFSQSLGDICLTGPALTMSSSADFILSSFPDLATQYHRFVLKNKENDERLKGEISMFLAPDMDSRLGGGLDNFFL